jgi:hypothetical protein
MEGARLPRGAAPTLSPATAGRAGSRLAYEPLLTGSVRAAGSGPGEAPGAGEETPAHAPAWPLVNGRRGGTASARPAGTALHPRAESADARLTARLARGCDPGSAAWSAASLAIFRLPSCSVQGSRRALAYVRTGTVHARKGDFRHDFACQPAFHPANPSDGCPAGDPAPQTCRHTCRPWPGRRRWSAAEYTCAPGPGLMTYVI